MEPRRLAARAFPRTDRDHGATPSPALYATMRRFAGAVPTYFNLLELCGRFYLPLHVRRDADVIELARVTNDITCWTNDVFSAPRELSAGDVHNLVIVSMQEDNLGLGEAIERVCDQCHHQLERYIALEQRILERLAREGTVAPYCAGLRSIIRGNLDWCRETSRYGADATLSRAGRRSVP